MRRVAIVNRWLTMHFYDGGMVMVSGYRASFSHLPEPGSWYRQTDTREEVNGMRSGDRVLRAGLAQGSVMSPLLFLLWACPRPQRRAGLLAVYVRRRHGRTMRGCEHRDCQKTRAACYRSSHLQGEVIEDGVLGREDTGPGSVTVSIYVTLWACPSRSTE